MMQVDDQTGFGVIIRTGEQIFRRIKELDMDGLEKEVPEYAEQIEECFLKLDKNQLSPADIESLEQLIDTHKNLVTIFAEKKEKLSINIKQLQTGKKMQNTYPKIVL